MKPNVPSAIATSKTVLQPKGEDDSPESLLGQIVADRYEIEELLGVGGMGAVYRAKHIHIRKTVALKTLHPSMLRSPEAIARFEREAIAAARINHPNVVVATDYGHLPDGRYYLVLEFVEGRNLRQTIDQLGPLLPAQAVWVARQIASALVAAHTHEIVHRDLKPENVMLIERAAQPVLVKVLDFGIAKITLEDKNQPLTQMGAVFGTPQYMSPEQAKGLEVDGRSDLYALGIILYEMLTGRLPFTANDALGFLLHHLNTAPDPLPEALPHSLQVLVQTLLEKPPENRPPSAASVLVELDKIAHELAAESAPIVDAPSRPFLPRMRERTWALLTSQRHFWLTRRRVRTLTLPTYAWVAPPAALLFLTWHFLPLFHSSSESKPEGTPSGIQKPLPKSDLPSMSEAEFRVQLERIGQLKVYQRTELDWMILARGAAQAGDYETSVGAYQALLSLRKDFRKDPQLLADILAAAEDKQAARVALNLCETILGRHGVDLLWRLWQDLKVLPDQKEQTEKFAKKLVILSRRASPALRVAIELTFTSSCDKLLVILGRAAAEADERSITRLTELDRMEGCGASNSEDCFACLRSSPLLSQALKRAQQTKAPNLGETPED